MSGYFQRIACRIGKHDLTVLKMLSAQAALCECDYCREKFAVKIHGDCAGSIIAWDKAETFYTEEKGHSDVE